MESERSDFLETNSKGLSENKTVDSDIKLNSCKTEKIDQKLVSGNAGHESQIYSSSSSGEETTHSNNIH